MTHPFIVPPQEIDDLANKLSDAAGYGGMGISWESWQKEAAEAIKGKKYDALLAAFEALQGNHDSANDTNRVMGNRLLEQAERIAELEGALRSITKHQASSIGGNIGPQFSATWNIARKALGEPER